MTQSPAMYGFMCGAVICAFVSAACVSVTEMHRRKDYRRKQQKYARAGGGLPAGFNGGMDGLILRYAMGVSHRLSQHAMRSFFGQMRCMKAKEWFEVHAPKAGVGSAISSQGFIETAGRLTGMFALGGVAFGALFSFELAVVALFVAALLGAAALPHAIKRIEHARAQALGNSLSEMLEVVSLGMRSGLSFDRSFQLYAEHFNDSFARECEAAQRLWTLGLSTREEALRNLAASYDSSLLAQVSENIIRSLHFGSSITEGLEAASVQARAEYRSCLEERVAKAPIKMMFPTSIFILPAMLIFVLGPVILELVEGC